MGDAKGGDLMIGNPTIQDYVIDTILDDPEKAHKRIHRTLGYGLILYAHKKPHADAMRTIIKKRVIHNAGALGLEDKHISTLKKFFSEKEVKAIINKPFKRELSYKENIKQKADEIWNYLLSYMKDWRYSGPTVALIGLSVLALLFRYNRPLLRKLVPHLSEPVQPYATALIDTVRDVAQHNTPYIPPGMSEASESVQDLPIKPPIPQPQESQQPQPQYPVPDVFEPQQAVSQNTQKYIEDATNIAEAIHEEITAKNEEITAKNEEITAKNMEVNRLKNELGRLGSKLQQERDNADDLHEQLAVMAEQYQQISKSNGINSQKAIQMKEKLDSSYQRAEQLNQEIADTTMKYQDTLQREAELKKSVDDLREKLDLSKLQLSEYSRDLASTAAQNRTLEQELSVAQENIKQLHQTHNNIKKEIEETRQNAELSVKEKNAEIARLEKLNDDTRKQHEAQVAQIRKINDEKFRLENENKAALKVQQEKDKRQIDALTSEISDLQKSQSKVSAQLADIEKRSKTARDEYDQKRQLLENRAQQLEREIDDLKKQHKPFENKIAQLESNKRQQLNNNAKLESDNAELLESHSKLVSESQQMQKKYDELKIQHTQHKTKSALLSSKIGDIHQKLEAQKKKVTDLSTQKKELTEQYRKLELQVVELGEQVGELDKLSKTQTIEISTLRQREQQLTSEVDRMTKEKTSLEKKFESAIGDKQKLAHDMILMNQKIAYVETELDDVKKAKLSTERALEVTKKRTDEVGDISIELSDQVTNLREQILHLQDAAEYTRDATRKHIRDRVNATIQKKYANAKESQLKQKASDVFVKENYVDKLMTKLEQEYGNPTVPRIMTPVQADKLMEKRRLKGAKPTTAAVGKEDENFWNFLKKNWPDELEKPYGKKTKSTATASATATATATKKGKGYTEIGGSEFAQFPKHLINSDEIRRQKISWFMNDELDQVPDDRRTSVNIMNLDDSDQKGSHWTVFIISKPNGKLFYVDPFAKLNGIPDSIRQLARRLGLNVVSNKYIFQHTDSNFCGYIAIYLTKKYRQILKRMGYLKPADFERVIVKSFTKHPNAVKMRSLYEWAKKNHIIR